jgi:hypothetical protein
MTGSSEAEEPVRRIEDDWVDGVRTRFVRGAGPLLLIVAGVRANLEGEFDEYLGECARRNQAAAVVDLCEPRWWRSFANAANRLASMLERFAHMDEMGGDAFVLGGISLGAPLAIAGDRVDHGDHVILGRLAIHPPLTPGTRRTRRARRAARFAADHRILSWPLRVYVAKRLWRAVGWRPTAGDVAKVAAVARDILEASERWFAVHLIAGPAMLVLGALDEWFPVDEHLLQELENDQGFTRVLRINSGHRLDMDSQLLLAERLCLFAEELAAAAERAATARTAGPARRGRYHPPHP